MPSNSTAPTMNRMSDETSLPFESATAIRCVAPVRTTTNEEVRAYMHLVHQIAASMAKRLPASVLRADLAAAGAVGLLDALRKHGGDRGPQFEWYARTRIRGAIIDDLRQQDWLSRGMRAEATSANEHDDRFAKRGAHVAIDDLAQGALVSDAETPLDLAERQSERVILANAVAKLPAREASIVTMHYFQGVPFNEIAAKLGVSEPRISQLHSRATKMLREILASDGQGVELVSGAA
jgi:RNA polymerase sigma factor for flagellar operon FliA